MNPNKNHNKNTRQNNKQKNNKKNTNKNHNWIKQSNHQAVTSLQNFHMHKNKEIIKMSLSGWN